MPCGRFGGGDVPPLPPLGSGTVPATFSLIPDPSHNLIVRILYSRRVSLTALFTMFSLYF